jgi:hypothetical protein
LCLLTPMEPPPAPQQQSITPYQLLLPDINEYLKSRQHNKKREL